MTSVLCMCSVKLSWAPSADQRFWDDFDMFLWTGLNFDVFWLGMGTVNRPWGKMMKDIVGSAFSTREIKKIHSLIIFAT